MKFLMRLGLALFIPIVALATDVSRDGFASELRSRLLSKDCALNMDLGGAEILSLSDHHFLDLAQLSIEAAEGALLTSVQTGVRTGGKTYPFITGFSDIFLKPLRKAVHDLLLQEAGARSQSLVKEPLYFSIVGLGREALEFPVLVELIDSAVQSGVISLADLSDVRIGLYDVKAETLKMADLRYEHLSRQYPWLQGRVDVRFFDMSHTEFAETWTHRRLAMVVVRNSLRNQIVDRGWPMLVAATRLLVRGGVLVVDREANDALIGPGSRWLRKLPAELEAIVPDFTRAFSAMGSFGLDGDESESFLLGRR